MNPAASAAGSRADRSLRDLRRVALAALAAGALFAATRQAGAEPPPDRALATLAIGVALASVVFRRLATSPRIFGPPRAVLAGLSLLCALALGAVGVFQAAELGARQTGLLFCAAAAIFCLRSPPPVYPQRGARAL